jgi:hypothetical protein
MLLLLLDLLLPLLLPLPLLLLLARLNLLGLFPGALPLASAGVGGYIETKLHVYLGFKQYWYNLYTQLILKLPYFHVFFMDCHVV